MEIVHPQQEKKNWGCGVVAGLGCALPTLIAVFLLGVSSVMLILAIVDAAFKVKWLMDNFNITMQISLGGVSILALTLAIVAGIIIGRFVCKHSTEAGATARYWKSILAGLVAGLVGFVVGIAGAFAIVYALGMIFPGILGFEESAIVILFFLCLFGGIVGAYISTLLNTILFYRRLARKVKG